MSEQEHAFDLATGTVPDPFGLGWDHERQASDEEPTDTEVPGSAPTDTTGPDPDTARLGELD